MKRLNSKGLTLVELTIAIALFTILSSFLLFDITNQKTFADFESTQDLIFVTVKEAQNLAMATRTESYGVHFETDRYVLFQGSTYNPADPSNLETTLDSNLTISSVTLPSGNIIFFPLIGEAGSPGSFVLKDAAGAKTFTINQFGAINVN